MRRSVADRAEVEKVVVKARWYGLNKRRRLSHPTSLRPAPALKNVAECWTTCSSEKALEANAGPRCHDLHYRAGSDKDRSDASGKISVISCLAPNVIFHGQDEQNITRSSRARSSTYSDRGSRLMPQLVSMTVEYGYLQITDELYP